jgi:hydrogenase maturation protein HypF
MACAWLVCALGPEPELPAALRAHVEPARWSAVAEMARTGFSAPPTSSVGRLFDAVAALCGVRAVSRYEGQAAIELEGAAGDGDHGAYTVEVGRELVLDPRPALHELLTDLAAGTLVGTVSSRFHAGVARATAVACARAASGAGLGSVALSGGVFQNRRLLGETAARLEAEGLRVLVPERLPPNDGGIAYGQAAIAAAGSG